MPEIPPIWKFPAFIEFLENFGIFPFLEIPIIFSIFGNFYHFWTFHHFSILGHSHQIISFFRKFPSFFRNLFAIYWIQ